MPSESQLATLLVRLGKDVGELRAEIRSLHKDVSSMKTAIHGNGKLGLREELAAVKSKVRVLWGACGVLLTLLVANLVKSICLT